MSVPVARFVLSKIEKGEVKFPTRSLSFNAGFILVLLSCSFELSFETPLFCFSPSLENRFTRRQTITTGLQDWQNEFCDEDDEVCCLSFRVVTFKTSVLPHFFSFIGR